MKTLACLLVVVLCAEAAPSVSSWWYGHTHPATAAGLGWVTCISLPIYRSIAVKWNPTLPDGTLKPFPCYTYKKSLTEGQNTLCFLNPYILSAAVRGLWRAFGACSHLFGSDTFGSTCWNCSIYAHHFLLGQAVETTPNREREFIRMLVSASITYEIARACREKLIPDCHCAPSDIPFINRTGGKLIIAGCNVDMNWAAAYTRLIMNGSNDRIEQHNIEVGIAFANRTFHTSVCRGPLGSCSIEVHYVAPELTVELKDKQNVTRLQTAYRDSVWVDASEAGGQWPPHRVVFGNESHDFCCTQNPSIGIPGTRGRKCNPEPVTPDSCDRICCGRGYTRRTYQTVEAYKLVETPPPAHLVAIYKTVNSHHCN